MMSEINPIMQTATHALSPFSMHGRREVSSAWARQVRHRGLWPLGETSPNSSVEGILEAMEVFEEP